MTVWARADFQSISAVPGCDQSHSRPVDPRTGEPVPIWELECEGHERWICGLDKQPVLLFEPNGLGGFTQRRVQPMVDGWARSIDSIPLTPDQMRADAFRNSLTRRAEQAMLAAGIRESRLALESRPATAQILKARALAGRGRGVIQQAVCNSCHATYSVGAIYCPMCAVRVGTVPASVTDPAEPVTVPEGV